MKRSRHDVDRSIARIVTWLAVLTALAVAVALPAAHFISAYTIRHAEITNDSELAATTISQLASGNPDLWVFEKARIRGLLAVIGPPSEHEHRIVWSKAGAVVAEQGNEPPWPWMTADSPIYDSGTVVGRIEIQYSQRRLLSATAVVALLSAVLAAVVFVVLKSLPLRLLDRALAHSTHLATHDALTGLPNRVLFQDRVERAFAWLRRNASGLAVLYLDLDHFKDVNDTLGHAAGDRLLVAVTARLQTCVRETDTLARLGGDEFAILHSGAHQPGDTELLAQRLISTLEETFDLDGCPVTVGVSVGIATRNPTDFTQAENVAGILLQEADVALYRAKEEGRGTYRFFSMEMNQRLLERRHLEADILEGLECGQFTLHYQPQFDLAGLQLAGAEALIRWQHPVRGTIGPQAFISFAEETALISRIGEWVLMEACRQAAEWPELRCLAVNVSPVQFRRRDFFDQVERALQRSGLDPRRLEIEITEGVMLHETDETLGTLRRLRNLGVSIAMDDFGTGYSSLGYLQKFRFDKIKIDRSFVSALQTDPEAAEIVRAVLRMSHAMGIRVNAEGVEYEQQASVLREEGCEEVQGFLFGRPVPAAEFSQLLARNARHPLPEVA